MITQEQYFKLPTESIEQYNQRIAGLRGESPVITGESLTPQPIPTLPQPKTDITNYNSLLDHGQGVIGANGAVKSEAEPTSDLDTRIKALQESLNAPPPSLETAYQTASEQAGITTARETALTKQSAVRAKQSELAGIQAQIQGVISKRDAENLRIEQTINLGSTGVGGAGALASTSFLNVRKQEINRQAAIEALPLQALALAKQAEVAGLQGEAEFAQSTLKLAQDKLDTAFKLKSQDIENEYNTKKENRKAIYDFLTDEQKRRADAKQKQEDRDFKVQQDNQNNAQQLSRDAMNNGQPDIAAKLNQLDPKSKTYAKDIADLQAKIVIKPKVSTTETERTRILKTSAITMARPELEKSVGKDGYIDPKVYIKLRNDYAQAIGDITDFDNAFAPLLNPQDRINLGIQSASGLISGATPTPPFEPIVPPEEPKKKAWWEFWK